MYIELLNSQKEEVSQLLNVPIDELGEWSLAPDNGPVKYAVKSTGDIVVRLTSVDRAGRHQKPRICNFTEDSGHYLFCNFNTKQLRLHRVIAKIWLPDYSENLIVNHIDGNKHNNDYHNLEMLSSSANVAYYHTSEAVKEQRLRDYAYHGTRIRGRIHITDGVNSRMIYEADGISEGWWRGRPQSMKSKVSESTKGHIVHNSGKLMITDGTRIKYINKGDPVPEGWKHGGPKLSSLTKQRMSDRMKDRAFIHKGDLVKRVKNNELQTFLDFGWMLGKH